MNCIRIKKKQEWGEAYLLIPIQSIKAIEFHEGPSYVIINYLDKFISGHVNNEFNLFALFKCVEQSINYSFDLWEHFEEVYNIPNFEDLEEKDE